MALVVNRTTGEILPSVNTPDYPETDWIINPDLSQVTKVWPYIVIVGDVVRDMTALEQAAYDLLHPPMVNTRNLADGTPSFAYTPAGGIAVSSTSVTAQFATETTGSKNFYLGVSGIDGQFVVPRNAVVVSVTATIGGIVTTDVALSLRKVGQLGDLLVSTLPALSTSVVAPGLAVLVDAGDVLSCFLTSDLPVVNPMVNYELAWRN